MLIRYIGAKEIKYDNVNDPQAPYIWSAENGYVVDVLPEHCERLLKHEQVWQKAKAEINPETEVKTDGKTDGKTDAEAPVEADAEAPVEAPVEKGRRR